MADPEVCETMPPRRTVILVPAFGKH